MRITSTIIVALSICAISCTDNTKSAELAKKENDLTVREKALTIAEAQVQRTPAPAASPQPIKKEEGKEDITSFIRKDYSIERNHESLPHPKVQKVFLLDYNHDGLMDGVAYATGHNPGAKFNFQCLGLYKNENGKLRLVHEKQLPGRVSSVTISNNNLSVTTMEFADSDPMCCPSIQKVSVYSCDNDKIH
ncbi:MAG: hypothetical protein H0X33_08895 [Taibaiella sp.]|nr:hypothetical protein [Taibaiella sp.]